MVSVKRIAHLQLTESSSMFRAELAGELSDGKRRRLFTDLPSALVWARSRAEVVSLVIGDTWWSAGSAPYDTSRARPLSPDAEAPLVASVDEAFRRSDAEHSRSATPRSWYFAFWVHRDISAGVVIEALEAAPSIQRVDVRDASNNRNLVIVYRDARSRDEMLRRGEREVREALLAFFRTRRLPGFDGSSLGHHQIGLAEFEHREDALR